MCLNLYETQGVFFVGPQNDAILEGEIGFLGKVIFYGFNHCFLEKMVNRTFWDDKSLEW